MRRGGGIHVKTGKPAPSAEGNPHPVNAGALCHRGQASLQGLYNPGRTKGPMVREGGAWKALPWDDAIGRVATALGTAGGRVAVISGAGPGTLSDLLGEWTGALGGRVVRYEPSTARRSGPPTARSSAGTKWPGTTLPRRATSSPSAPTS